MITSDKRGGKSHPTLRTQNHPYLAVVVGVVHRPGVVGVVSSVKSGIDAITGSVGSLHHLAPAPIIADVIVLVVPMQRDCVFFAKDNDDGQKSPLTT